MGKKPGLVLGHEVGSLPFPPLPLQLLPFPPLPSALLFLCSSCLRASIWRARVESQNLEVTMAEIKRKSQKSEKRKKKRKRYKRNRPSVFFPCFPLPQHGEDRVAKCVFRNVRRSFWGGMKNEIGWRKKERKEKKVKILESIYGWLTVCQKRQSVGEWVCWFCQILQNKQNKSAKTANQNLYCVTSFFFSFCLCDLAFTHGFCAVAFFISYVCFWKVVRKQKKRKCDKFDRSKWLFPFFFLFVLWVFSLVPFFLTVFLSLIVYTSNCNGWTTAYFLLLPRSKRE